VVHFEDGGRDHIPRNVGSFRKLEKAKKKTPPPLSFQEESALPTSLF
jgi:hypothetical protein